MSLKLDDSTASSDIMADYEEADRSAEQEDQVLFLVCLLLFTLVWFCICLYFSVLACLCHLRGPPIMDFLLLIVLTEFAVSHSIPQC